MKANKQTGSESSHTQWPYIISTIVVVLFFGFANLGYSAELSVNDRLDALEQRVDKVDKAVQEAHTTDWDQVGNMVMFRGGGAWLTSDRSNEVFTDVFGFTGTTNDNTSGWYVGGALNLLLTKDMWGMALGELGVEYKRWTSNEVVQAVPTTCAIAIFNAVPEITCPANLGTKVQLTMLTVSVSPKIMFLEGSRFRP